MIVRQTTIAASTVLADGDIGVSEDTGQVKLGDGVTAWSALTAISGGIVAALAEAIDDVADAPPAPINIAGVTGLQAALDGKAALDGPTFTGTPTAPTPAPGDNSTKIATTAFVAANGGGGGYVSPLWSHLA